MANGAMTQTQHIPYLAQKGLKSWILSTDHKRIGDSLSRYDLVFLHDRRSGGSWDEIRAYDSGA